MAAVRVDGSEDGEGLLYKISEDINFKYNKCLQTMCRRGSFKTVTETHSAKYLGGIF